MELAARKLPVAPAQLALFIPEHDPEDVLGHLESLRDEGVADPLALAASVPGKASEKYDWILDRDLLNADYASRSLDTEGALEAIRDVLAGRDSTA